MNEADATLTGEVMALRTIIVLLLRQLDQGGTLPPGWTALAREACLRSVADVGRQAEGPLTEVMLGQRPSPRSAACSGRCTRPASADRAPGIELSGLSV